jgi:ribosomal protein S12 methylthiotransferase
MISLGCAKNLVNAEQMMYLLEQAGYEVSGETEGADAVIVNTCGFIDAAKSEAIDVILELAEAKAAGTVGKIIVTGCLSQRYQDEVLQELPEVDALCGTGSYDQIVSVCDRVLAGQTVKEFGDIHAPEKESGRVLTTSPLWEYIKIAEGCSNYCAFCVIPYIRGRYRSRPMDELVREAEGLAAQGIRELIVIAQDITRYGTDLYGERRLAALCRELGKIEGVEWIRLHYLYPEAFDDELIDEIASNDKIVKYLDIPIQHINDGILKAMHRRGTGGEIRALFQKLRARIPGLVLRTSLITGLPGEGETEFEELCDFLKEARIERAGVFPFSPEEGTPAAAMEHPDPLTAQRRAELVMELQARIMDEFCESRIGQTLRVLCQDFDEDSGLLVGRSYADSPDIDGLVFFEGSCAPGEMCDVLVDSAEDGFLYGKEVEA